MINFFRYFIYKWLATIWYIVFILISIIYTSYQLVLCLFTSYTIQNILKWNYKTIRDITKSLIIFYITKFKNGIPPPITVKYCIDALFYTLD